MQTPLLKFRQFDYIIESRKGLFPIQTDVCQKQNNKERNMRYYNILDFKLQELYVFTVTAEFESITKAANYLYLTPSQVSKIIKKLECLWGVELFIQDKNSLRLRLLENTPIRG